ncbi:MAG TPA: LytTR family DNA-binding domain-containing protein [Flavitalea sp.]|nr:LytTR family DNA-binding domain-containing protein [Flavitalea sp.]
MIKAIIVDDEIDCCETIADLLQTYCPSIEITAVFHNGAEALTGILKHQPDLVFLDVEMPRMNGFEMLELLPQVNFDIIFTTSYDQYALKAIRFSAIDYLLKPIDRNELQKSVQKVAQRSQRTISKQVEILMQKIHQPGKSISKIALPTMEGLQMIPVDSIISCESDGNYTIILLKSRQKLIASTPLKEIEDVLEDHSFVRVHRCYLVNLNEVEKYVKGEGGYLVMSDGSSINVSRSKKDSLLKKLLPR